MSSFTVIARKELRAKFYICLFFTYPIQNTWKWTFSEILIWQRYTSCHHGSMYTLYQMLCFWTVLLFRVQVNIQIDLLNGIKVFEYWKFISCDILFTTSPLNFTTLIICLLRIKILYNLNRQIDWKRIKNKTKSMSSKIIYANIYSITTVQLTKIWFK